MGMLGVVIENSPQPSEPNATARQFSRCTVEKTEGFSPSFPILHLLKPLELIKRFPLPLAMAASALAFSSVAFGEDAQGSAEADLAMQLNNPIAALISVPFQANYDFGMGPTGDGSRFTLNIQPVVPIPLGKDWNLIVRTILPIISQHDVYYRDVPKYPGLPNSVLNSYPPSQRDEVDRLGQKAYNQAIKKNPQNRSQDGLGDTTQSFFLSPNKPLPGGIIMGLGPVFLYPTATQDLLGSGKWGAGPTFVALKQTGGWTMGLLANQVWSIGGTANRADISAMFLQPFLSYTTSMHTSFTLNTESTYNWEASQWTVPINLLVSQVFKIGKQPMSIQLGGRYYAEGPDGVADWGMRLTFTLLFPTAKHTPEPADGKSFAK